MTQKNVTHLTFWVVIFTLVTLYILARPFLAYLFNVPNLSKAYMQVTALTTSLFSLLISISLVCIYRINKTKNQNLLKVHATNSLKIKQQLEEVMDEILDLEIGEDFNQVRTNSNDEKEEKNPNSRHCP